MPFYNFEIRTETHVMVTEGAELADSTQRVSKPRDASGFCCMTMPGRYGRTKSGRWM
jgi:hypothetical protein